MDIFKPRNRKFTIEVDGYRFRGEFPLPGEQFQITAEVSRRTGGLPVESIPADVYYFAEAVSTLNLRLRELPDEFPKQPPQFDWGTVEDPEFTLKVYAEYESEFREFRKAKKKSAPPEQPESMDEQREPAVLVPDEGAPPKPRARRIS